MFLGQLPGRRQTDDGQITGTGGLPGGDRTPDNRLRRPVLYPTELRAERGQEKLMVGAKGFEPSTLWSQTRCATRLRYTPTSTYSTRFFRRSQLDSLSIPSQFLPAFSPAPTLPPCTFASVALYFWAYAWPLIQGAVAGFVRIGGGVCAVPWPIKKPNKNPRPKGRGI